MTLTFQLTTMSYELKKTELFLLHRKENSGKIGSRPGFKFWETRVKSGQESRASLTLCCGMTSFNFYC